MREGKEYILRMCDGCSLMYKCITIFITSALHRQTHILIVERKLFLIEV